MSLGRLNNSLYDERGQFIGNQQPEADMFYGFNPTGAIGEGVSSGNIPAVANPLDSAPAGGGKGGGKGGGFTPPPPQNMYGGVGYNSYMGAGGIRPTSTPAFTSGFTSPAMTPSQGKGGGKGGGTPPPAPAMSAGTGKGGGKGGGMSTRPTPTGQFAGTAPDGSFNPPTSYGSAPAPAGGGKGGGKGGEIPDYMKEMAGRIGQPRMSPPTDVTFGGGLGYGGVGEGFGTQPQQPTAPAGGGLFGGLANAANLLNQQRQRNDFMSRDNELNRIRGAQMELERKARQEALNRSYYGQPEEPTDALQPAQPLGPTLQPAKLAEPAQPPLQFGDPGYMPTATAPTMTPASRNPYDRRTDPRETFDMGQMERLNAAFRNRMDTFNNPRNTLPEYLRPYTNPYHGQQLKFLEEMRRGTPQDTLQQRERRLISELADPAPGSALGGLGALAMGGNPFMR